MIRKYALYAQRGMTREPAGIGGMISPPLLRPTAWRFILRPREKSPLTGGPLLSQLEMYQRRRAIPLRQVGQECARRKSGMNPRIPILVALATILAGIATAIRQAHPYLAYSFYGVATVLLLWALFLARKKPESPSASRNTPPKPPPNIVLHGFEMTPIEKHEGSWGRLPGGKMAWLAFIRNAPLEDRDVGLACLRAEILYYPEKGRCHAVSPATWLGQGENTACIKSGDTKDLVIAVEIHPRLNWSLLANGSPCSYGDLWATCPDFEFEVRLIDDASGKLIKPSYCFKWKWRGESRPSIYVIDKITLQ